MLRAFSAKGFASPAPAGRRRIAVAARQDDLNTRLRERPLDDRASRLRRVSAAPSVRDHAVADFDRAGLVWRPDEADVPNDASAAALDHHPDAEALGFRRRGGLEGEHIEKIGLRPRRRLRRPQNARRLLSILGQGRSCQCGQRPQLDPFGGQSGCRHSAKLAPGAASLPAGFASSARQDGAVARRAAVSGRWRRVVGAYAFVVGCRSGSGRATYGGRRP